MGVQVTCGKVPVNRQELKWQEKAFPRAESGREKKHVFGSGGKGRRDGLQNSCVSSGSPAFMKIWPIALQLKYGALYTGRPGPAYPYIKIILPDK